VAPDHAEADVVVHQGPDLQPDVLLQQLHQRGDLRPGPLPVLDREGIQGQDADAQPRRGLHGLAHRVDARPVALHPRQVTHRRPAAVAVHADGDVLRLQHIGKDFRGKLTALIRIKDFRTAIVGNGFFQGFDTK